MLSLYNLFLKSRVHVSKADKKSPLDLLNQVGMYTKDNLLDLYIPWLFMLIAFVRETLKGNIGGGYALHVQRYFH